FCACSPTTSNTTCAPGSRRSSTTMTTGKPQPSCATASSPRRSVHPPQNARKPPAPTEDALPVHSFQSLIADLATYSRIQVATALNQNYVFTVYSRPTPTQARAFELLGVKPDRTQ